jgi:hypothetical protein
MTKTNLTVAALCSEAGKYARIIGDQKHDILYGITDGKAVGTHIEHGFRAYLDSQYSFEQGNSAAGIDFPSVDVDMKVTSQRQPQSSCPFKSASQKVYGLGYSLIVFVYDKRDSSSEKSTKLDIVNCVFVEANCTADFQTTSGLIKILENKGNKDDISAYLRERMLPIDEIGVDALADQIFREPPKLGYLTVSNALQWRLQYSRVIEEAGKISCIQRIR